MNRKFQSLIYTLSQGNPKILLIFLISALFVTIARALAPIELSWDPAVQIQAANHLIQGLGLTTVEQISPHLNDPPNLIPLTHFPPGFSLVIALFLAIGFSLVITLKILYSITTIVGWLGWGIIGCYCLRNPLKINSITIPAQFALAAILPLFYTPGWGGTDIFLWAAVPFVVLLLFNSIKNNSINYKLIIVAAIISSMMIYLRYASACLLVLGFAIILQQGLPNLKNVFKSSFCFFLTSGLAIAPLYIYLKIATSQTRIGPINFQSNYANLNLWESLLKILQSASVIANIPGLHLQPEQYLNTDLNIVSSLVGLICLIIIFSLLFFALIKDNQDLNFNDIKNNLSFSVALIPSSIFLVLLLSNLTASYDYIGTFRYYMPAVIPVFFLSYEFATVAFHKIFIVVKYAFLAFIIAFLAYNLIISPVGIKVGKESILVRLQKNIVSHSFKIGNYQYPSNKIITIPQKDETRLELERLQKENPEAIVFVHFYPYYLYQAKSLNMKPIPNNKAFWDKARVDEKTLIFWEQSHIEGQDCQYAICSAALGSFPEAIGNFSDGTIVENVFESSQENTKIIKTYFPKATKIKK